MNKKIAKVIHHTHWDNEWYFTEDDAYIQFLYNMQEILDSLELGECKYFLLDGQTAILEDYLSIFPEDLNRIKKLVEEKKLTVGPLLTQFDCFITNGESMINNIRLGLECAEKCGGSSDVVYLPDSFGQSSDFPKLFKNVGMRGMVFRRGKNTDLKNDFVWLSKDGSELITSVQNAGYGFATLAFTNYALLNTNNLDYDNYNVYDRLKKLADESGLDNEFMFPVGFDQKPLIHGFTNMINYYNEHCEDFFFEESSITDYIKDLERNKNKLERYSGEFFSTHHHRMHKSLYSARADIKTVQDEVERIMALEVQPLMTLLDSLGLAYIPKIIDKIWNLLGRSQTHSSATNSDPTNEIILKRSQKALNLAVSLKAYLMRMVSISVEQKEGMYTFAVFNTLPYARDVLYDVVIYTNSEEFSILSGEDSVEYTIIETEKINKTGYHLGTLGEEKEQPYYYKHRICFVLKEMKGISYKILRIKEIIGNTVSPMIQNEALNNYIEDDYFKVEVVDGKLNVYDKQKAKYLNDFIYLENSGDQGDNYDYDYPQEDFVQKLNFENIIVKKSFNCDIYKELNFEVHHSIPRDLESLCRKQADTDMMTNITITLKNNGLINFKGFVNNNSENHRVRFIINPDIKTNETIAGTQFGFVKREKKSAHINTWKEERWLEEPSGTWPLLNHVTVSDTKKSFTIFSRGVKEYELKEDDTLALTLFRCVGHLGKPNLNRRPGRPSGLRDKIIETPLSQMKGKNKFEFALKFYSDFSENMIFLDYIEYAVDKCYYQNQRLNRLVYNLSYFHCNPLITLKNDESSLLQLTAKIPFISLVKKDEDYLLRVFNASNEKIEFSIESDKKFNVLKSNVLGYDTKKWDNTLNPFELTGLLIQKK